MLSKLWFKNHAAYRMLFYRYNLLNSLPWFSMSTAKSIKYTISEKKSRPKDQLSICEIVPHVVEYSAFAEMSAPMDPNDDDESIKTIIE